MLRQTALIVFAATASIWNVAVADERLVPLAISGNWIAMAHRQSITSRADVCMVANMKSGFAIRVDETTKQIRVIDDHWSLPSGATGTVTITIGDWHQVFDIDDNTSDSVNAEIDPDVLTDMLNWMDKATSMSVTVGKAKPFLVPLAGSTRATNAFMTCAGIKGHVGTPGSNPLE